MQSEFLRWLALLGEATSDVGHQAMEWMRQQNMVQYAGLELISQGVLGGGKLSGDDSNRRRESVASSRFSLASRTSYRSRFSISSSAAETEKSSDDASSPTTTDGNQDARENDLDQGVLEAAQLSFEPLYECVHIFETLQCVEELRDAYSRRRREELETAEAELRQLVNKESTTTTITGDDVYSSSFAESAAGFLKQLSGFFIVRACRNAQCACARLWIY